jgi:hypothetical protein
VEAAPTGLALLAVSAVFTRDDAAEGCAEDTLAAELAEDTLATALSEVDEAIAVTEATGVVDVVVTGTTDAGRRCQQPSHRETGTESPCRLSRARTSWSLMDGHVSWIVLNMTLLYVSNSSCIEVETSLQS